MQTAVLLQEITRLKLRLTFRHYRKQLGNAIGLVFAWLAAAFGAAIGAIGLAMHIHTSPQGSQEESAHVLFWVFWILSLVWMFSPFAQVDAQRNLDLNGMRSYPLSGSQFLLVVILDALLSPISLFLLPFALVFLAVVAFGGIAILPMLFSLLMLCAVLLCLTQGLFLLVNRLLQSRRFADMSMLIGLLVVVVVQVINFSFMGGVDNIGGDFSNSALRPYLAPLLRLLDFSFPSLAASASVHWSRGQFAPALAAWGLLAAWLLPAVWFVGRTARSFYEGELESGGPADERSGRERSRGIAGLLPPGELQAMVEREQRYARRDPMLRSLLIQSLFFGIYMCVMMLVMRSQVMGKAPDGGGSIASFVLLGLSFALSYSESGIFFNRFGYEGSSLATLLASPVSRRRLLTAKSLFLLTHLGLLNILLVVSMGLLLRAQPLYIAAAVLMIIANLFVVDMAGMLLSVVYPFGFVRQGRRVRAVMPQQGCSYIFVYGLLFNVCNLLVLPGSLAIVLGAFFYGWPGLLGGTLLAGILTAVIWGFGISQATQLFESREHRLLEALSRKPD